MATSLFDEPPSLASFQEYPNNRPFFNSGIARSDKPIKAYPENSSEAVLSALKGLQDKIQNLELDRSRAEKNLKALTAETSAYKSLLNKQKSPRETSAPSRQLHSVKILSPGNYTSQRRLNSAVQIESQLRNADARCELLERQLDNMRKMVENAERERSDALERQIALERDRGRVTAENRAIQSKLDRMEFIQNRFDDLESRKNKSEARIKDLEERLKHEEHQRKLLNDRAAQLQTDAESKRILSEDRDETEEKAVVARKKKKKKKATKISQANKNSVPKRQVKTGTVQPHYRLNLADIPFIVGTSTSPSHGVSANLQRLIHDLKQHNPIYCNEDIVCGKQESSSDVSSGEQAGQRGRQNVIPALSTKEDLNDLLAALQDEFGKLTFEHQVLVKQIGETFDLKIKQDLELELKALINKMERKGEQISTVKRHITQLNMKRKTALPKSQRSKSNTPSRRSRSVTPSATVRIGNRFPHSASSSPRNQPVKERERRLAFLKEMRNVRSALHKDDLSWD